MKNIFTLSFTVLLSRIISCYSRLFSNLKHNKHNIIICKVIKSHLGPLYIETHFMKAISWNKGEITKFNLI